MTDFEERAQSVLPVLVEEAVRIDADAEFPQVGVDALREAGLFAMSVPVEYGGLGGSLNDLVDVAAILSSGCLSTAMVWAMHCQQIDAVVRYASEQLREELLPRVVIDGYYLASVTTEPGKGGHLLTAESAIDLSEQDLHIERWAPVVTGGEHANGFLVTMRSGQDASPNQVTLVHLDRSQTAIEITGDWEAMGMRGTRSVPMKLDGVASHYQIIGKPGRFREVAVESMIPVGHVTWAACWLGAARGALGGVVDLVRSSPRSRNLSPDSELVRHHLANVRISLELVSSLLTQVTETVTRRRRLGQSLNERGLQIQLDSLKVASADISFAAIDELVQLAGVGFGYLQGSPVPLERVFRDLRSASLNNSNDRLRQSVGGYTLLDGSKFYR